MNPAIKDFIGLIIGFIAVVGGLGIAAYAIYIDSIRNKEEKLTAIEARNKERLKLIEMGMDPSIADKKPDNNQKLGWGPLMWGLLFAGIGLGYFIGFLISIAFPEDKVTLINAMGLLFGGISLIGYFIYRKRLDDRKA